MASCISLNCASLHIGEANHLWWFLSLYLYYYHALGSTPKNHALGGPTPQVDPPVQQRQIRGTEQWVPKAQIRTARGVAVRGGGRVANERGGLWWVRSGHLTSTQDAELLNQNGDVIHNLYLSKTTIWMYVYIRIWSTYLKTKRAIIHKLDIIEINNTCNVSTFTDLTNSSFSITSWIWVGSSEIKKRIIQSYP